jgi:hypothetical protein
MSAASSRAWFWLSFCDAAMCRFSTARSSRRAPSGTRPNRSPQANSRRQMRQDRPFPGDARPDPDTGNRQPSTRMIRYFNGLPEARPALPGQCRIRPQATCHGSFLRVRKRNSNSRDYIDLAPCTAIVIGEKTRIDVANRQSGGSVKAHFPAKALGGKNP